ncbi:subclass B1 metallo-beta-lactamase [bacterium]|nr:subclass B1 metallo-beta-lactamase [bacterium]
MARRISTLKFAGLFIAGFILSAISCSGPRYSTIGEELKTLKLNSSLFMHISYLETEKWGKVACNGLVYFNNGEALIMDAPVDSVAAKLLIHWITEKKKASIKGIVINHFHVDCLGSLEVFHDAGIPSYANEMTVAKAEGVKPQNPFSNSLNLRVGEEVVINKYFGPAHTEDNIVSYIPAEAALFGGCMVKSLGSGAGNLADADVIAWPKTIAKIKSEYPDLEIVVPGHGAPGKMGLLNYTESLFSEYESQ